jgi:hypothetical protein
MSKIRQCVMVAAMAALPLSNAMAADGDFSATVGLKAWVNNWSTWNGFVGMDNSFNDVAHVYNVESSNTTSWIPSVSVRYKDFMVGGSYFAKRSYDIGPGFRDVKREEFDLIGGYYILPTLAIIGGYKEVDQWFANGKYKYSGPIVGFSASAPLTSGFSLYGTAAVGLGSMDAKRPSGTTTDADYRLGEVGLAYAFNVGGGVKSLIGTFGYRSQVIVTDMSGSALSGLKGRDTTEGFTLGLVAAF